MEEFFGQNILNKAQLLKKYCKHLKTMRDQYRRALKLNPKYEHPPMVPQLEWNGFIVDAKEKRLRDIKELTHHLQKKGMCLIKFNISSIPSF